MINAESFDKIDPEQLKESELEAYFRWGSLILLQKKFKTFPEFVRAGMLAIKGFDTDELQMDIAKFMDKPDRLKMVQAQRGEGKSIFVGFLAVFRLMHDPTTIILIISAGADVSNEIATWIKMIIENWDILECMIPNKAHGDRTSAMMFDINYQLKGVDKSPSVCSIGINANLAGRRAGLLIADDVESVKNASTVHQRQQLLQLTLEFPNICRIGEILYLGTPQTVYSVYNTLTERGFLVRIWPGRYPTDEGIKYYGDKLAPYILKKIEGNKELQKGGGMTGKRGKPTSKIIKSEDQLTKDEIDMGPAYFDLQVMLDTRLSDASRYPLKPKRLIICDIPFHKGITTPIWLPSPKLKIEHNYPTSYELYAPHVVSEQTYLYDQKAIYIDPAGGGLSGDETVAVVGYLLDGRVYVPEILALPGGYDNTVFEKIIELAQRHNCGKIVVEENMGKGAFAIMLRSACMEAYRDNSQRPIVLDQWVNTNKEKRIIDAIEPLLGANKLIISPDVLEYDVESTVKYGSKDEDYQLMAQLANIQYMKGSIAHDDRIDALAGLVSIFVESMAIDTQASANAKEKKEENNALTAYLNSIGQPSNMPMKNLNMFDKRPSRR